MMVKPRFKHNNKFKIWARLAVNKNLILHTKYR
jgi:hypothetical protein